MQNNAAAIDTIKLIVPPIPFCVLNKLNKLPINTKIKKYISVLLFKYASCLQRYGIININDAIK